MTQLARVDPAGLVRLDKGAQEVAVSGYLENARRWLATAVEMTGPEQIAAAKAEIATAAEATKQLNLSKEIQLDAQEMVRRAEYALGKAIRKAQQAGTINRQGSDRRSRVYQTSDTAIRSVYDYASHSHLYGDGKAGGNGLLAAADYASPEEFDVALEDAKAEKNLSRANVVRKVKNRKLGTAGDRPVTRAQRISIAQDLADKGYTSDQIAASLGIGERAVREYVNEGALTIPADKVMSRTRTRIDGDKVVSELVAMLETSISMLQHVDIDALNESEKPHWADSLVASTRTLTRFAKQLKEPTQ